MRILVINYTLVLSFYVYFSVSNPKYYLKLKEAVLPIINCNEYLIRYYCQRAGIAAGGIFYNVQPGTAAQLKIVSS